MAANSSNFGTLYSRCYDLLYGDKHYAQEAAYVHRLLKCAGIPENASLLELGSGTGRHAALLAGIGYHVVGVERSAAMLAQAMARAAAKESPSFAEGDVRSVRLGRKFAAVISLFHVVSYMTTDDDLFAMIDTIGEHLDPGGRFLFDIWFTPAVLWQRPESRIKKAEDEHTKVTRFANSEIDFPSNIVTVHYTTVTEDKQTGEIVTQEEAHPMRHFGLPELRLILARSGLTLDFAEAWLTGGAPSSDSWSVVVGGTKKQG